LKSPLTPSLSPTGERERERGKICKRFTSPRLVNSQIYMRKNIKSIFLRHFWDIELCQGIPISEVFN